MSHEYFRVTDYPFESLPKEFINEEVILNLPEGSVVVDVGSGITQEFARTVKGLRTDITVVSLDPTLGIGPGEENWRISQTGDSISYIRSYGKNSEDSDSSFKASQTQRLVNSLKDSSVAGLAPELPLASYSVNLLVDAGGAARFIRDKEVFEKYLHSILRVLKSTGSAVLTDIGCITDSSMDPFWDKNAKLELGELTSKFRETCSIAYFSEGLHYGLFIRKS